MPAEAGRIFKSLSVLRDLADYGGSEHVAMPKAQQAIADARHLLDIVRPLLPLEQPAE